MMEQREPTCEIKEARALGAKEMKEILDRYTEAELGLLFQNLTTLQLNYGCSSQCDFCGTRTPKGPRSYFTAEAINYLMSREVLTLLDKKPIMVRDLLKRRGENPWQSINIGGFADEIMDNPDFLKIIETIPASHKLSITTSYPDVTDVYNKLITLIKFCRSRKIGLRISVREENYERLVRDGLLTITEKQNGEKYLCPVKKLWPLGLSFVYRFAEEKTKNGLIIRDYDQKHDGLTKVGRNVEGAGKMHTKIGGSEVVLSPTGFWNFLLVRIQNELTYRLHKKSAGMDHLPAKITDHFSNLTNLSELIGGKTEISVHDILRHGILKRHESDLEQQSEQKVPGYDNEDLRAFYMGSVTEGHNGVEEISIQVIYQVVPEVAPRVVKIRVANMRQKTYEEKIFPPSPSTSTFAS